MAGRQRRFRFSEDTQPRKLGDNSKLSRYNYLANLTKLAEPFKYNNWECVASTRQTQIPVSFSAHMAKEQSAAFQNRESERFSADYWLLDAFLSIETPI